jgi:hypothetical protein
MSPKKRSVTLPRKLRSAVLIPAACWACSVTSMDARRKAEGLVQAVDDLAL